MNKRIPFLFGAVLLASCTPKTDFTPTVSPLTLTVACPSGAPAISLYNYLGDKNLEISTAQTVISYFTAGSKDIVILPTDTGVKMIQREVNPVPYKLAATVTFGNFFLARTGNDYNNILDKDDYVVVFQQNAVSDSLFKYVYGNDFTNVHYVADVNAAARCLISGKNEGDSNASVDYVLMAQPALANALNQNGKASIHSNLQTLYKEKTGGKEIAQASIFVNNSADGNAARVLLGRIGSAIETLLYDPAILDAAIKDSGLEMEVVSQKIGNPALVKNLILNQNQIGIGFKFARANKPGIDAFLTALGQNTTLDSTIFE